MDGSKVIQHLMIEEDKDAVYIGEQLGMHPQSIRNKIVRNSWTLEKFQEMLKVFDAELVVLTKDGKVFK